MVPEYSEILSSIAEALEPHEFKLMKNEESLCVFGRPDCFVVLEGERYVRGAFGLGIAHEWPTSPSRVFNLRLLMQVFDEDKKPSLQNQLNFLVANMQEIFEDFDKYEARYRLLNGD
ncbi:hypothetical protein AAHK20_06530 [Trinickia sp. YCB016]